MLGPLFPYFQEGSKEEGAEISRRQRHVPARDRQPNFGEGETSGMYAQVKAEEAASRGAKRRSPSSRASSKSRSRSSERARVSSEGRQTGQGAAI